MRTFADAHHANINRMKELNFDRYSFTLGVDLSLQICFYRVNVCYLKPQRLFLILRGTSVFGGIRNFQRRFDT